MAGGAEPVVPTPDWNVEKFGPERPACRHDFNTVVGERNRYRAALERVESLGSGEAVRIAREALENG